jgi:DNA-directed RNA polymerase subunit RPC12/RpoP
MNDSHEEYMSEVQTYNYAQDDSTNRNQHTLQDTFRTSDDSSNVGRETSGVSGRELANQYHYYGGFRTGTNGSTTDHNNQFSHDHAGHYEESSTRYRQSDERMDGTSESYVSLPISNSNTHRVPRDDHHSGQQTSNHTQFLSSGSQSAAAVPIPAMALQVSSLSSNYGAGSGVGGHHMTGSGATTAHDGAPPKARCIEEDYAIILHRSASAAAKSSNTKYRCLFCSFTFVGGPQKIRVHLTGKRENGTRLSRCEHCPEDVRRKLEERMKAPKEAANEIGLYDDDESDTPSLPPRNVEEHHTIVLSRSQSSNSKSSNTRYKCIYCRFKFVGGPQKIRVHLTGQQEGGTRMQKCARVPEEVTMQMEHRRKAPKPDLLATPGGSANAVTSSTSTSSSQNVDSSASTMTEVSQPPTAQAQQQAFAISQQQQQQALQKQQQHHAAQLQIQQQQLQQLQRQQQIQHQLHAQQQIQQHQHIQHLQQLHQQQIQAQMQQQHLQHSLHGVHPLSTHPAATHSAAAQLHGGSLPLHLHPQHMLQLNQPTPAQMLMHQQQLRQHSQLAQHLSHHHPIPPQYAQALQAHHLLQQAQAGLSHHLLHPAAQTHRGYDLHDEATTAVYHAELQQQLQAAHAAAAHTALSLSQAQASTAAEESPVASPITAESATTVVSAAAEPAVVGEASR